MKMSMEILNINSHSSISVCRNVTILFMGWFSRGGFSKTDRSVEEPCFSQECPRSRRGRGSRCGPSLRSRFERIEAELGHEKIVNIVGHKDKIVDNAG